jgi:hypothetical protein
MNTPTVTTEISQLGHLDKQALIEKLTSIQKEIDQYSQRWTENKIEAGNILLKLRKGVPHGEWESQLKEICKAACIGRSTAHRYMDLAEGRKAAPVTSTVRGYAIDEIKSALQKAVRLGDEHLAMQCAVELDLNKNTPWLWDRLHDFASEDVGLAAIGLHREIEDLHSQWKKHYRKNPSEIQMRHHPERLFLIHAVLLVVRVRKSRLVDHALITYYNHQQPIEIPEDCKQTATAMYDKQEPINIPDAALDKHTRRGKKLGRKGAAGINHFFDVGATLKNESPAIEDPYKESARQALLHKVVAPASLEFALDNVE